MQFGAGVGDCACADGRSWHEDVNVNVQVGMVIEMKVKRRKKMESRNRSKVSDERYI